MTAAARAIVIASMPVRLYPPPNRTHEFAWVSFDDLLRATEFPLTAMSFWAERWLTTCELFHEAHRHLNDGAVPDALRTDMLRSMVVE